MNPTHIWSVVSFKNAAAPPPPFGSYYETDITSVISTVDQRPGHAVEIHLVYYIMIHNEKAPVTPPVGGPGPGLLSVADEIEAFVTPVPADGVNVDKAIYPGKYPP